MFLTNHFYLKEFCKPLSKEHSCRYNNVVQLVVWEEKIFKKFLLWSPCQREFFIEQNYLKEFEREQPKEHSCEIS